MIKISLTWKKILIKISLTWKKILIKISLTWIFFFCVGKPVNSNSLGKGVDCFQKVSSTIYSSCLLTILCTTLPYMGVRRFFPGEGKIFQVGGKNILFALKTLKRYYFPQKHTILAGQGGGQEPPLALPCGRPCLLLPRLSQNLWYTR